MGPPRQLRLPDSAGRLKADDRAADTGPSPAADPGPSPPAGPAAPEGGYEGVMERAGRLLARRAHSERELRDKLAAVAPPGVVDRALGRLRDLGLVDDVAFARDWLDERARRKGLAPAALVAELGARGVAREVAEAAVEAEGFDEEALATEVAARLAPRLVRRPLADQAGRLQALLLRRGFSPEAAEAAVRAVLPPEGWD